MGLTIPTKDADFVAFVRNLDADCSSHAPAWNLDMTQVATLNQLSRAAESAYNANKNPETSNRLSAANKRGSFLELKVFLSTFIPTLVANKSISESELEAMGLPSRIHHFHEALPVPTDAPETTAVVGQHHDITVYVAIPQHGHPSEFLKKKEYHGFVVRYRKEGESEWHEEHTTRLHQILLFDNEDEGKHLILTTAWINPRIEHGPWSDEIRVLIN
jgi:hypothetical protein